VRLNVGMREAHHPLAPCGRASRRSSTAVLVERQNGLDRRISLPGI
jgi:hypothetical protein